MDPYLSEKEAPTVPGGFQSLEVTPSTPEGNYALDENIPAAGHHRETNLLIGELSQKQFNQMSQESNNAALVYQRGSMYSRATLIPREKVKKITDYIDVLVSDSKIWRKWVQNEYYQAQIEEKRDREIQKSEAYWAIIKDNFAALLKKLHELSHRST